MPAKTGKWGAEEEVEDWTMWGTKKWPGRTEYKETTGEGAANTGDEVAEVAVVEVATWATETGIPRFGRTRKGMSGSRWRWRNSSWSLSGRKATSHRAARDDIRPGVTGELAVVMVTDGW